MCTIINNSALKESNIFLLSEDIDFEFLLKSKLIENTNFQEDLYLKYKKKYQKN